MNAERLLKHYERIADAPDAIARLRRFILDLAVRGKLVPQDPKDERASELLKRIAKEKARLVKVGEIRKPKQLSPLDDRSLAFACSEQLGCCAPRWPVASIVVRWGLDRDASVARMVSDSVDPACGMPMGEVRRVLDGQSSSMAPLCDGEETAGRDLEFHAPDRAKWAIVLIARLTPQSAIGRACITFADKCDHRSGSLQSRPLT